MQRLTRLIQAIIILALWSACGRAVPSPTPTITPYPFVTATPRPTSTLIPPTYTPSPTATAFIPTDTPAPFRTVVPTTNSSPSPTPEATATTAGVSSGPCLFPPSGIFLTVYESDPGLPSALGCPTAPDADTPPQLWPVTIIYQPFERGHMFWASNVGWFEGRVVYVLYDDAIYYRRDDTFDPTRDPASGILDPPEGMYQPINQLGKVWRMAEVRERLGFALAPENQADGLMQLFEYGEMVTMPQIGAVFVLKHGVPGTWTLYQPE